eukprot:gnl/MRDRNA2_/MRDRNA2_99611_c0_seq1.p1 gnl/MRDRNA2_/MRDRNA2_99611_c0~~gnl/MRDRNA2_/MRDRNA2_99611_c0_seq1.p1  ORF type:complete len:530 (+),score=107.72 gnl/MRDRNA2_/MRDRNA2_99611_c0_seq1:45-1634(+)
MKSSVSAPFLNSAYERTGAYERNKGRNAFVQTASIGMFGSTFASQTKASGVGVSARAQPSSTSMFGKTGGFGVTSMQMRQASHSLARDDRVLELKPEQLASLIHWQRPTLVLFYVPWCTKCIDMMVFWDMLASKLAPVVKTVQDRSFKRGAIIPAKRGAVVPAASKQRGQRGMKEVQADEGQTYVGKMMANFSNMASGEYGVESVPLIKLFAGGEIFCYDMDKLYDTQGFQACSKQNDALISQVIDWIAASMNCLDVKAMEARQRELQAIEEKKLDGIPLKVILMGQEFDVPRASVSTVRDVANVLSAKVGLDKVGRMLQLSAGQTVFANTDSVRVLPQEVYATVVALAVFKPPENESEDEDAERLCTVSEDGTTATCSGETNGRWQVVEGNFKSEGTLGFAIRLDKLQGGGAIENVGIGVAPADFALNDDDDCLSTNAVAVISGSLVRHNLDSQECNDGENWTEGKVIRVVFQGVSGKVAFFWDGELKASCSAQLKRPVRAIVLMRHPGDQVTFVDARLQSTQAGDGG